MTSKSRTTEKNFEPLLQGEYVMTHELDKGITRKAALKVADVAHDADDCRQLLSALGLTRGAIDAEETT